MMSFVFAPAVKNKPNLQNVFTSMTLSMKTPLTFACCFFFLFFAGFNRFSIRCESTVTWDFAKVTKMAHGGKPFFLFSYILMTNRET